MRLFISINFNDEIKNELIKVRDEIKANSVSGNFTDESNFHLTLVFIGEVSSADTICHTLDKTEAKQFQLSLHAVDRFRRAGGDIFFAGVKKTKELIALQKALKEELVKNGFKIEARDYSPHVTLGRQVLSEKTKYSVSNISMIADKISLMKSERIKGKLIYTEIYKKII